VSISRRAFLAALGVGAVAAGAAAVQDAKPATGETTEELGARKQASTAPNPLGVTQQSFQRKFGAACWWIQDSDQDSPRPTAWRARRRWSA
jgi:hypothetical protein